MGKAREPFHFPGNVERTLKGKKKESVKNNNNII
jgi:hypothetical protein